MDRQSSAAAAAQANGAGSSMRWYWPPGADQYVTNNQWTKFNAAAAGSPGSQAGAFGGAVEALAIRLGSPSSNFPSAAASGCNRGPTARPPVMTERSGGPLVDDVCAFSFRATLSIPILGGALAANRDLGIGFACGVRTGSPALSAQAGVMFGPTDVATIRLRAWAADGGGLTVNQNVTAFDYSTWHTWELRGVWGSSTQDPFLIALIDGTAVTPRISWTAAAALLPPLTIAAGAPYYTMMFWNASAGVSPTAFMRSYQLVLANNEAGLV